MILGTRNSLLNVYSSGGSGPVFPDGMVARWTLDNTGAGYVDLIGGLTLTPQGSGVGVAPGIIGDAFTSSDGVSVLAGLDWAVTRLQIGFFVEFWYYYSDTGSNFAIVSKDINGARDWQVRNRTGNRLSFFLFDTFGTFNDVEWSYPTGNSTWYHIVCGINSSSQPVIYIDSVLRETGSSLPSFSQSSAPMVIGPGKLIYTSDRVDEICFWQFGASGDPGAAFWLNRYNGGAGRRP